MTVCVFLFFFFSSMCSSCEHISGNKMRPRGHLLHCFQSKMSQNFLQSDNTQEERRINPFPDFIKYLPTWAQLSHISASLLVNSGTELLSKKRYFRPA